jgi:hypothetical protein
MIIAKMKRGKKGDRPGRASGQGGLGEGVGFIGEIGKEVLAVHQSHSPDKTGVREDPLRFEP